MLTHDEVIFALNQKYPELVHGIDYWVGQEMQGEVQVSDARVYVWNSSAVKEPTQSAIKRFVKSSKTAYTAHASVLAERGWRNSELERADKELLKSEDGDGVGEPADWRRYRKELRSWPTHEKFPDSAFRPKSPDSE